MKKLLPKWGFSETINKYYLSNTKKYINWVFIAINSVNLKFLILLVKLHL